MSDTTVIISESSYLIRNGLTNLINKMDGIEVVKNLDNGERLPEVISKYKPNFVIVNPNSISTKKKNILLEIKDENNYVIIISDNGLKNKYKADAEINVQDSKKTIIDLLNGFLKKIEPKTTSKKNTNILSVREQSIIKEIATGLTNKEIAEKLFISIHTVVTHRKNITHKLGIKSVSGLTVYAIINKLINMEEVK